MGEYLEHHGMTWEILEPANDDVTLGITIAYGLMHEPASEVGALQIAAEHLRREFGRPLELADGVYVPSVQLDVHPALTAVWLRGRRDAIIAAYRRLHRVFEEASVDPATPMARLNPKAAPAWNGDIAVRLPRSGLALQTMHLPAPGAATRAATLLRELSPRGRRHRCLLSTTDASIIDALDWPPAPPVARAPKPQPSLAELPGNDFGAVHAPLDGGLWSTLLPRTPDGFAALHLLTAVTERALASLLPQSPEAQLVTITRPADLLVMATASAELTIAQRRRLAQEVLIAPMPIADPHLHDAVANVNAGDLGPWRRLDRLFGAPPAPDATAAGARAALVQAGRHAHLKLPHVAPLPGVDPADVTDDLPWALPPLAAVPRTMLRANVPANRRGGLGAAPVVLGLDGARLVDASPAGQAATVLTGGGTSAAAAAGAIRKGVDLERLLAVYVADAAAPSPDTARAHPESLELARTRAAGGFEPHGAGPGGAPEAPGMHDEAPGTHDEAPGMHGDRRGAPAAPGPDGNAPASAAKRPDIYLLVDRDLRELIVVPGLYRGRKRLEELLDRHTAGVPRIPDARLAPVATPLLAMAKKFSRTALIAYSAAAALLAFVLVMAFTQGASGGPFRPVVQTLEVGETAQLHSGSRLTLLSMSEEPRGNLGTFDVAEVRFCAGDDLGGGYSPSGQRWFDPAMYELFAGETPLERMLLFTDDELAATELAKGECGEGTIAFRHQDAGTLRLVYSNTLGDEITWTVP